MIIVNEYFVETWLGDDPKITMDMWNLYTKLTNEQATMLMDGIPSLRKWWENTTQTSSSSWMLNMILLSFEINVLHKCFMVYFPFKITDSYIYIAFL